MQIQCKPNAESLLYAEVQPVFAAAKLGLLYPVKENNYY